jgi:predicted nucleotidyltransferase
MTTISHNLTGKIDERTVALLSEIDTIAGDLRLPFFIVGVTARDILLQHAHDIHPVRATLDIDIGVFVSDWDQFLALKEAFEHTGKFSSTKQAQRLNYTDDLPLDIVPFGGVSEDNGLISWPPEHEIEMDAWRRDKIQKESYEQIVAYFNALLRGLLD